ncbi:MAG: hypothetical protein IT222_02390, partial [Crocinitomix sp.]|nr:hypothetical protein [Crocinitomix sp.]
SVNEIYFNKIIRNLENLGVLAIEIRIIKPKIDDFELIEEFFENTVIETIIQRSYYYEEILNRIKNVNFIRTKEISLYNAPEGRKDNAIHLHKRSVNLNTSWNREFRKPFTIDRRFYIEAQKSLAYFYSKLFIGINGEIKNAPECQEIHGNFHHISDYKQLKKIVTSESFQKYWHISKNEVEICKDCEFRFMCLDNRIPLQRKSDGAFFYDQPCTYNPYINKWSDQEGYQFPEDCGILSNHNEFQINHEKIRLANELIGNL